MTIKMTDKARKAVSDLAVQYCAYNEAIMNNCERDVKIWGRLLLASQDETGVELITREFLKTRISHNSDLEELEKQEAANDLASIKCL